MISVEAAQAALLALVSPLPSEDVPLRRAAGRVLARTVAARHAQPPFAASAMDGYAVAAVDVKRGDRFRFAGEAAAGHPFAGAVGPGETVRIFTGAPVPEGTARVLIQEDVARDGDAIAVRDAPDAATHVRPAGGDFAEGATVAGPRRIGSRDVALLAAMGHGVLPVRRRPRVAILMTGDELRAPGEPLGSGGIVASNGYGLAAMVEAEGAEAHLLPIARDTGASLAAALDLARGADLIVTIGGASVGDHDLVAGAAGSAGLELAFHTVAMRPGKPLLAGRLGSAALVGLPGNPVSAMVCGVVFILPMIRAMLGLSPSLPSRTLPLADDVAANGSRRHYMRAVVANGRCRILGRQNSSLLSVLHEAHILAVIAPDEGPLRAGEAVEVIALPD